MKPLETYTSIAGKPGRKVNATKRLSIELTAKGSSLEATQRLSLDAGAAQDKERSGVKRKSFENKTERNKGGPGKRRLSLEQTMDSKRYCFDEM